MELSLRSITLLLSLIGTGLTAGLCFTWSNAIIPGIGRLDNLTFLQSFQAMNRVIINPSFLITFFGPVILLFLNAYLSRHTNIFWLFLLVAILFFMGVGMVTIFKNIPLNEILDQTLLETISQQELADLRQTFEKPWTRWHMIRTITSFMAFILLLTGLLFYK
ncbi:anthrone oxygenase family protein [Aquimarina sp. MMG016]|uniref:anthrone oxygenase family protein n=1 Tax=Aquimarina sp. MMG016 TaxID=2822690 RepID=UPI001B3A4D95|nr:anthrone oxygenase family protein [Aquimarina sp. MMG016]MBQ4822741.1 DUF1772 domain-containing protein [Aquimarina sp. MMG016]